MPASLVDWKVALTHEVRVAKPIDGSLLSTSYSTRCKVLGTFPAGEAPVDIAFGGTSLWVTDENTDQVTRLRASNGTSLNTLPVGDYPQGIIFDGTSIWVVNGFSDTVSKISRTAQ